MRNAPIILPLLLPLLIACSAQQKREPFIENAFAPPSVQAIDAKQIEALGKDATERLILASFHDLARSGLAYRFSISKLPSNRPDLVALQLSDFSAELAPSFREWLIKHRAAVLRNPHARPSLAKLESKLAAYASNALFVVELRNERGDVLDRAPVALCEVSNFLPVFKQIWETDHPQVSLGVKRLVTNELYQSALQKCTSIRLFINADFLE